MPALRTQITGISAGRGSWELFALLLFVHSLSVPPTAALALGGGWDLVGSPWPLGLGPELQSLAGGSMLLS